MIQPSRLRIAWQQAAGATGRAQPPPISDPEAPLSPKDDKAQQQLGKAQAASRSTQMKIQRRTNKAGSTGNLRAEAELLTTSHAGGARQTILP